MDFELTEQQTFWLYVWGGLIENIEVLDAETRLEIGRLRGYYQENSLTICN